MTRIVAVHQPNYLPYLGFFHKMMLSDIFVLYDIAQYSKNDFHNRNRIKTPKGPQWLTVPVRRASVQPICDVQIGPAKTWPRRHLATLKANYARTPHFGSYFDGFESIYQKEWNRLASLNEAFIDLLARSLGIRRTFVRSSEMSVPDGLSPSERLAWIVRKLGGDGYLSGPAGPSYLDSTTFSGLTLLIQEFHHPEYPQAWGPFTPNLSAVDALFNAGDGAEDMIQSSGQARPWA